MVFAVTGTGALKVACCQPVAVSPLKVTVASFVLPVLFHSEPACVPVLPAALVEPDAGDVASLAGAELDPELDRRRVVALRWCSGRCCSARSCTGHPLPDAAVVKVQVTGSIWLPALSLAPDRSTV